MGLMTKSPNIFSIRKCLWFSLKLYLIVETCCYLCSQIDILIGGLDANLFTNRYFVAGHSYYQDSLTWCVQTRKPIPVWQSVYHLCTDPLVYCIAILAAVSIVFSAYFFQQFEPWRSWDWNRITFNGISMYFGVPIASYNATTYGHRILFTSALFSAIILTITVSSYLTMLATKSILNSQRKSVLEIVDENFNLTGDQFSFNKISQQNTVNALPFVIDCNCVLCSKLTVLFSTVGLYK